jgi:NAD(P)-dependent dehydrogenase (short-subunit alcohol dehydrogenase family)
VLSKVVVVTGASAGVGRASARRFARQGYDVALLARGDAGLASAASDVRAAGSRALAVPVDVANDSDVERAAEQVEAELGPIEVWVNSAFVGAFAPFWEVTADEYHRVTEVTYLGVVHGTMSALRRMRARNHGTIVQVGSALAYRGIPLQTAYSGAKHAIQGFTEALRCELLHDHSAVKISTVQLPALNTPQFSWGLSRMPRRPQPVPPIYQPEVAARAIVYAAEHPNRREYWVGASTVATIVANAVAPSLLDRYLGATGFKSQQTDEPADPSTRVNLWKPVDDSRDFGAHGRFDRRSHPRSLQWWFNEHRARRVGAAALVAVVATSAGLRLARRQSPR